MAPKNKKNKPKKGKNDGKKEEKDDTQIDIVKKSLEAFDKLEADLDTVIQVAIFTVLLSYHNSSKSGSTR